MWKLTEECWHPNPVRRPDVGDVLRRLQPIVSAGVYQYTPFARADVTYYVRLGEEKTTSPLIEKFRSIGLSFDSVQRRINKLDQVRSPTARLEY
jgi:hypothetical protein